MANCSSEGQWQLLMANYNNLPNMFLFFLTSAISKAFVATLSMCLFAGKDKAQKLFLFQS